MARFLDFGHTGLPVVVPASSRPGAYLVSFLVVLLLLLLVALGYFWEWCRSNPAER